MSFPFPNFPSKSIEVCCCHGAPRTMELLTTSDFTLKSVVDRVRRAVVVDDDVLDRDKARPVWRKWGVTVPGSMGGHLASDTLW